MKKLFLIFILLVACSPALVQAQTATPTAACTLGDCHCTWQATVAPGQPAVGGYEKDIPGTTSADECNSECNTYGYSNPEAGVPAQQGSPVLSSFTCTSGILADTDVNEPLFPQLNVVIPGLGYAIKGGQPFWAEAEIKTVNGVQNTNLLGTYVKALYAYLLGAASIVAVTMLMIAGLQYATSRGDAKQVGAAKTRIGNAVAGIILLLLAYNIAFLINPATTTFDSLGIQNVKGIEVNDETPVNFTENYNKDFKMITADGPPLYDQNDYQDYAYGPERCNLGSTGNIKSSGCGVVSFAMAVAHLTNTNVNPVDVANSFYNNGQKPTYRPVNPKTGCGENGTYGSAMYESPLIEQNGLLARQLSPNDRQELRDLLKKDKLIITSYRTSSGGGHYVVISGYTDDGRLIISNPYGGTRESRSEEWWFSTIKSATYIDKADDFIY